MWYLHTCDEDSSRWCQLYSPDRPHYSLARYTPRTLTQLFFYLAGETEVSVTALVVLSQFSGSTTLLSTIVGMSVSVSVSVVISPCQYCQEVYIWSIALTLPDLPLTWPHTHWHSHTPHPSRLSLRDLGERYCTVYRRYRHTDWRRVLTKITEEIFIR